MKLEGFERLRGITIGDKEPRAWIARLDAREAAGESISATQRAMRDQAKANLGDEEITIEEQNRRRTNALKAKSENQVADYVAANG